MNVQSTQEVYFLLSDEEYSAYGEPLGMTSDINSPTGPYIMRDLKDIFSVTITEMTLANVKSISTVESTRASPGYYDVAMELAPTEFTQADTYYMVILTWELANGEQHSETTGEEVSWSQSELKSHIVKQVYFGSFSQSYCNKILGGGSANFWQDRSYEVELLALG
jgi:hypothetical protein